MSRFKSPTSQANGNGDGDRQHERFGEQTSSGKFYYTIIHLNNIYIFSTVKIKQPFIRPPPSCRLFYGVSMTLL